MSTSHRVVLPTGPGLQTQQMLQSERQSEYGDQDAHVVLVHGLGGDIANNNAQQCAGQKDLQAI